MAPAFLAEVTLMKLHPSMVIDSLPLDPIAPAVAFACKLMNFEFKTVSLLFSE